MTTPAHTLAPAERPSPRGPSRQATPPASGREHWMDLVRGAAILLVVTFHASAIPIFLTDVAPTSFINDLNTFFAPYRMSTLLLLSGMLLGRSLAKTGATYYVGKLRTLLWPYLVWGTIYWLVTMQDGWTQPSNWIALSWLWFIFYLAIYYLAAPLLTRIRGPWFVVVPLGLWALSAILSTRGIGPLVPLGDLAYYGGFFFAGHLIAQYRGQLARIEKLPVLIACTLTAAGFGALLIGQTHGTYFGLDGALRMVSDSSSTAPSDGSLTAATRLIDRYELVWIPVVLAGVAAIIMITRRLTGATRGRDGDSARWLQYIGRNSVVFYVVHYPAQIMITSWVGDWGMLDPTWMLIINTAVAMGLSYLFCWLRQWPAGDAAFVFPKLRTSGRPATP
ncbi:hypothetical protein C5E10_02865 [Pseudoclavibacter sp. RFBG4]|uniref:acyltransferase family protein n=1 Tax=Pseudoclavibacter sp. RFBG4 TaxID=2080575 RepID=UPI000CE908EC|nr:acyltransferase [Pseudoclavibacter sp. RFBG4]PPG35694.1 hypothetical protein C5E10_02865 [Pseudoclavibacter sp. RFBG4]